MEDLDNNRELVSYERLLSIAEACGLYVSLMATIFMLTMLIMGVLRFFISPSSMLILGSPTFALVITYFFLGKLRLREGDKVTRAVFLANIGLYAGILLFSRSFSISAVVILGLAFAPVFLLSFIWFKRVEKISTNPVNEDENMIDLRKINIEGKQLNDASFSEFLIKIGLSSSMDYFYAMLLDGKIEKKLLRVTVCYTIAFDEEKVYVFEMSKFNGWRIEHYDIVPKENIKLLRELDVRGAKRIELVGNLGNSVFDVSNKLFENQEKAVERFIAMID